jgi:hypothetical protein
LDSVNAITKIINIEIKFEFHEPTIFVLKFYYCFDSIKVIESSWISISLFIIYKWTQFQIIFQITHSLKLISIFNLRSEDVKTSTKMFKWFSFLKFYPKTHLCTLFLHLGSTWFNLDRRNLNFPIIDLPNLTWLDIS